MPIYPTKTFDYNFDNPACYPGSGTTVTDLQGNLNLAFVGTPTFSSSTGNGSYFSFDAANVTSNHLASAFSATLDGSFNCSMSFCIRAQDLNTAVYGGINSDNLSSENTFRISRITDQYWYSAIGYAGENVTSVATPVNKWVVVTVTSDYTNNQIKTYINGSLVKTDAFTTTYSFSDAQVILGFLNSTPYFNASLGDSDIKAFSFWKNVVLTAPQVLDVASEFTQYTSIVSSYDFSDAACYPGSGSTVFDLAGSTNLPIDGATYVSDGLASHFSFDGTNDYIGKNGVTGLGNTFSISLWSKYPAAATTLIFPFSAGTYNATQGDGPAFGINETTTNNATFNFNDGIGTTFFATTPDVWHNYTFTNDGTTTKAYKDGTLAASVAQGIGSWETGGLYLGVPISTGGAFYPGFYFNGEIATFDVYNVALGSTSVSEIYNSQAYRFQNLVASYDLNNISSYPGTGNTLYDLTGNNFDMTLTNTSYYDSPTYDYNSLVFNNTSFGTYSGSVGINTTTPAFTFFMWIKTTSFTGSSYNIPLSYGRDGNPAIGGVPFISTKTAGSNVAATEFGSGQAVIAPGTPTVLNEWTNYCTTCDGTTYKFYIDGVLVGSVPLTGDQIWTPEALNINDLGVSAGYACNLEFNLLQVYDVALSSGDITTLYNDTVDRFTVPVAPVLIGSYDFSDPACWPGSGNTVFDLTAENNDLLINIVSFGGTGQSKYASFNNDTSWMYKAPFSASGSTFISDEFTISLWHNYGTQGTFGGVSYLAMGGRSASGQGPSIVVDNSDQKVRGVFGSEITAGGWVTGIANTINTWHMTTLVGDGTNFLLYQDGALTGSTTQAGQWGGPNFIMGRPALDGSGPVFPGFGHNFGGLIGIAEVYSGALGSTDISDLYDLQQPRFYPTPPPPENLVASFDFSDPACYPGTGNTIFDLSNTGLDLPISGATYAGSGQSKYFQFDGVNDYIGLQSGYTGLGNTFTISEWINPNSPIAFGAPFSSGTNTGSINGPTIYIDTAGGGEVSGSFNFGVGIANTSINADEWSLITYTADGTSTKLYKNGELVDTGSQGIGTWNNGSFLMGENAGGSAQYSGKIALLEVYNEALDSAAITDIFENESPRFGIEPEPPYVGIVGGRQFAQGFNG